VVCTTHKIRVFTPGGCGKFWKKGGLILDWTGQLGEMGVSSDGKVEELYVDIRDSKVVGPVCVD
jgi:hypothetical protein